MFTFEIQIEEHVHSDLPLCLVPMHKTEREQYWQDLGFLLLIC
jgi:hypothetical protein